MADKPIIVDFETKFCAEIMQPLFDMVWDGLGETPQPLEIRTHIQAQPVAPIDGVPHAGLDGNWVPITPALVDVQWGDIGGTLGDQTDLQAALDLKADISYVDAQNAAQDSEHIGLIIALG